MRRAIATALGKKVDSVGDAERIRELEEEVARLRLDLEARHQRDGSGNPSTSSSDVGPPTRPGGLAKPEGFRSCRPSEKNPADSHADSLQLDNYYYKRGVLARPQWATKRGANRQAPDSPPTTPSSSAPGSPRASPRAVAGGGSPLKRLFSIGAKSARRANPPELVDHYLKISLLGRVMEQTDSARFARAAKHALAERFEGCSIPRVTLGAVEKVLQKSTKPVTLRVIRRYSGDETWADLEFDTVWANAAGLAHWGLDSLQNLVDFSDQRGAKKARFVTHILEACNQMALEDLDAQPTRHMYYHYGSKAGIMAEASVLILQVSPLLVETDGVVNFGLLYEHDAHQKYSREVMDVVTRSHAVFRYTETALTIFTTCGIMLQQNPLSCTLFGIVASENTMYSDFDAEGKPVNRLLALFGGNSVLYQDMWNVAVTQGGVWSKRMRLGKRHLRPLEGQCLTDRSSFVVGESDGEEEGEERGTWFLVSFTKFSDPSDGNTAIFCEMKNIHKVVLQERRLLDARRKEHELLQSMIPSHIIQHLLEQKREEREERERLQESGGGLDRRPSFARKVSFSSDDSDRFLDISEIRMRSDQRVRAVAELQPNVTVFFADIAGFTKIASKATPGDVMIMLNRLFTLFDECCEYHNVFKVETIGDSYMCVSGLNTNGDGDRERQAEMGLTAHHHASRMVYFARDVLLAAGEVTDPHGHPLEIRIGLHSGDVMSGVVGRKMPRFCLFGDTVNVASRMESTGRSGRVHASPATAALTDQLEWEPTGGVEVKGKGAMETFLLADSSSWRSMEAD